MAITSHDLKGAPQCHCGLCAPHERYGPLAVLSRQNLDRIEGSAHQMTEFISQIPDLGKCAVAIMS